MRKCIVFWERSKISTDSMLWKSPVPLPSRKNPRHQAALIARSRRSQLPAAGTSWRGRGRTLGGGRVGWAWWDFWFQAQNGNISSAQRAVISGGISSLQSRHFQAFINKLSNMIFRNIFLLKNNSQVYEKEPAPLLTPFQSLSPHQGGCRVLCSETDWGVLLRPTFFVFPSTQVNFPRVMQWQLTMDTVFSCKIFSETTKQPFGFQDLHLKKFALIALWAPSFTYMFERAGAGGMQWETVNVLESHTLQRCPRLLKK